jgi:hypothetical protein
MILRKIGIFDADKMKFGAGWEGGPGTFVFLLKVEALGQGGDGKQEQRSEYKGGAR